MNTINQALRSRLSRQEAAAYLGVSPSTLAVWGCTKRYNLPYVKVGRLVQYWVSDLDKFLKERTHVEHKICSLKAGKIN